MKLSEFCLTDLHIPPEWDKEFNHVATDSRDVEAGDLFIARAGLSSHGDEFIDAAVKAGAVVVLSEGKSGFRCIWHTDEASGAVASIPVFSTPDLGEQLSIWLHRRYASVKTLDLIGITGTNGKSSCAQYVAQLSSSLGEPCGVLGTLGNGVWPDLKPTRNTTADLATVLKSLEIMQQAGAKRAVMEVSSHGLEQGRVAGLSFRAVMMTNLTQDHLDYHGDMETYFAAKRRLFAEYDSPLALLNADDAWCRRLLDDAGLTAQHRLSFGKSCCCCQGRETPKESGAENGAEPDISYRVDSLDADGIRACVTSLWGKADLYLPLLGEFNLSNAVAAIGLLAAAGLSFEDLVDVAAALEPVAGRMELYLADDLPPAIVDFAHTPEALRSVLGALKPWNKPLSLVYGCGGDRDRSKRPLMSAAALELADKVWLTDDNPRFESPEQIFADALAVEGSSAIKPVHDRETAIRMAVSHTAMDGLLIIAGKGHEDWQEVSGEKHFYQDADVLKKLGYRRSGVSVDQTVHPLPTQLQQIRARVLGGRS